MSEPKKRGPKPKHLDPQKEIVVESENTESELGGKVAEVVEKKPKKLVGYHPITEEPVYI
jgi:hypothetical protein